MNYYLAVATLAILIPAPGLADVTRIDACERAGIMRVVELQSDGETGLPCRVVYKRPMEDQSETSLWNAQSDASYCVKKYDEFITKIETKHNWACTAQQPYHISASAEPDVQENTVDALTTPTPPPDSILQTIEGITEDSKEADMKALPVETPKLDRPAQPEEPDGAKPNLEAALPLAESNQVSSANLSITMIRKMIPSGHYVDDSETPHSGNVALCPSGGFFIWNTKLPTKPAFEMGSKVLFQFDLTELTDEPLLARADSVINRQCHEEVSAGYCSDNEYIGSTPLHPQFSQYFGCGSSTNKIVEQRKLVLFRSSVNPIDATNACSSSLPANSMALATIGQNGKASATNGIELVILPKPSMNVSITRQDGAICRYVRG